MKFLNGLPTLFVGLVAAVALLLLSGVQHVGATDLPYSSISTECNRVILQTQTVTMTPRNPGGTEIARVDDSSIACFYPFHDDMFYHQPARITSELWVATGMTTGNMSSHQMFIREIPNDERVLFIDPQADQPMDGNIQTWLYCMLDGFGITAEPFDYNGVHGVLVYTLPDHDGVYYPEQECSVT